MKILVVEDEAPVAEMLCRMLADLGNDCEVAPDAASADGFLESVDAVTLDLGMPGRSGLEWLEGVAACHPDLARRTLVITGRELDADSVERLARCGAGVLAKPFTLEGLQDAVRCQLARGLTGERAD